MTDPIAPDSQPSELARAIRVMAPVGPHPAIHTLMHRSRKTGETRRMTEFLRIDRGREA